MMNMKFNPFPSLTTERLKLRQLTPDDRHDIFALRSDPVINTYLDRAFCKSTEDALNFIYKVNDNIQKNNSVYWVISLKQTNTFVGTICLFDFSNEESSCEIGYELMTKFQGQGIMKEAAVKIIDYAFHTVLVRKIVAYSHQDNQKSTKLLTGFHFSKSLEINKENPDLQKYTLNNLL
ncbi:MAG: GNAT family N-acetyltransferase [Saprospiraceae bacterium]|jgi:ribosomal-protein-alanine N-acetyltransferase